MLDGLFVVLVDDGDDDDGTIIVFMGFSWGDWRGVAVGMRRAVFSV